VQFHLSMHLTNTLLHTSHNAFLVTFSLKFGLDMDVRWNATYLMLKHLIPYRHTFGVFIATNHPLVDGHPLITYHHWYAAEKLLEFLEQFMILMLFYLVFTIQHLHWFCIMFLI
jgi:hypothetical protein